MHRPAVSLLKDVLCRQPLGLPALAIPAPIPPAAGSGRCGHCSLRSLTGKAHEAARVDPRIDARLGPAAHPVGDAQSSPRGGDEEAILAALLHLVGVGEYEGPRIKDQTALSLPSLLLHQGPPALLRCAVLLLTAGGIGSGLLAEHLLHGGGSGATGGDSGGGGGAAGKPCMAAHGGGMKNVT